MDAFTRRFRRIVQLCVVLAILACIAGMLPGSRAYEDANNCAGEALGSLGLTEHHHIDCTPSYTHLVAEEPAGGFRLVLALAVFLIPGLVGYRKPRGVYAVVWPLWFIGEACAIFAMSFELRLFQHVVVLWPLHAVEILVGTILVLACIGAPIAALVSRPSDSLPRATDRSGSR